MRSPYGRGQGHKSKDRWVRFINNKERRYYGEKREWPSQWAIQSPNCSRQTKMCLIPLYKNSIGPLCALAGSADDELMRNHWNHYSIPDFSEEEKLVHSLVLLVGNTRHLASLLGALWHIM